MSIEKNRIPLWLRKATMAAVHLWPVVGVWVLGISAAPLGELRTWSFLITGGVFNYFWIYYLYAEHRIDRVIAALDLNPRDYKYRRDS